MARWEPSANATGVTVLPQGSASSAPQGDNFIQSAVKSLPAVGGGLGLAGGSLLGPEMMPVGAGAGAFTGTALEKLLAPLVGINNPQSPGQQFGDAANNWLGGQIAGTAASFLPGMLEKPLGKIGSMFSGQPAVGPMESVKQGRAADLPGMPVSALESSLKDKPPTMSDRPSQLPGVSDKTDVMGQVDKIISGYNEKYKTPQPLDNQPSPQIPASAQLKAKESIWGNYDPDTQAVAKAVDQKVASVFTANLHKLDPVIELMDKYQQKGMSMQDTIKRFGPLMVSAALRYALVYPLIKGLEKK